MHVWRRTTIETHEDLAPRVAGRRWSPLPLRLILGFGFIYHGFPKLFSASGHEGLAGMLAGMGVPAPEAAAWLVGIVEFFGGLALLLGFLVRPASVLLIVDMVVAMLMVHWPFGFNFMNIVGMSDAGPVFGMPGYEVNLLYIAGLLSLLISGPGVLSLGRDDYERPVVVTTTALLLAAALSCGGGSVRDGEEERVTRPVAGHEEPGTAVQIRVR